MKRNKTISSQKYLRLISWLKEQRELKSLTMQELSLQLNEARTYVHKVESLERRLDVYEFVIYCKALEIDPAEGIGFLI